MKTLVVTPTYNEADNIGHVISLVLALPASFHLLVVDDGSPDGTGDLVARLAKSHPDRIHLLRRAGKQGLGTAYIAGFRFALEHDYELVCEMDADLSHNPNDLPRLTAPIEADTADVVIGSRYVDGVRIMNWPLSRLILSYSAGIYTRTITRMKIQDVTAGFKCFRRTVLEAIDLGQVRSNGYSFQIEMNYIAWKKGFRISEVPIVFTERTEGRSKMSKAIVREATWKVWELRLRSLFGRL
ncbi:MAG: polyprenol monophosphomannose synthase [Bacteroidetes bacterium]|nr:polyprenol monophosphomannose synthase [Bacteroidota bacterium]MDA0874364.1 polyprenol monophosphomannose synthase [Bacteroidota bacterium]